MSSQFNSAGVCFECLIRYCRSISDSTISNQTFNEMLQQLFRNYIHASTKHYILWRAQIIKIPALLFVILNDFCTVSSLKWIIVCGVWRLMIRTFIILAHLILRCARIMTIRAVLFVILTMVFTLCQNQNWQFLLAPIYIFNIHRCHNFYNCSLPQCQ